MDCRDQQQQQPPPPQQPQVPPRVGSPPQDGSVMMPHAAYGTAPPGMPSPGAANVMHGMPLAFNTMASPGASSPMKPADMPGAMYRPDSGAQGMQHPGAGGGGGSGPVVGGSGGELVKKKRGRPRKYGPDGSIGLGLKPAAGTATEAGGQSGGGGSNSNPDGKRKGRPPGSGKKKQLDALGSSGTSFTPHIITVKPNEDVASKIMAFSQQGPRTTCIISANGSLCTVTLRQPATSGGIVTYEGHFDILSLSGSFLLAEDGDTRSRTGGLSVALAGSDGRIVGGCVAGMLMAATPVQVVMGSFIAEGKKPKGEQPKREPTSVPPHPAGFGAATAASLPSDGTSSEHSDDPATSSPENEKHTKRVDERRERQRTPNQIPKSASSASDPIAAMMDPEMLRLAQEQMRRMSPDDLARMQQQLMSNPDLFKLASESMKNMKAEDLRRAAQQMNQARPEDMREMTEKIANATPEEFAAMKAQADAQMSYTISGAKMLKKQGNELHNRGQYSDAAAKYKLAKDNLKNMPSSAAHTLQLQCTLNLMACYLKTGEFDECISEGSEVLTYDSSNVKAYYRRGQAYKELGKLEAAVADLSIAHEISPEDETIAEVLRDTEEKLAKEGGTSLRKGVVIEEVVEDDTLQPSSSERSSPPGYSVSQPPEGAENSGRSEFSKSTSDDIATIRSSQNHVSKSDPEVLSKLGMQGMSPELVKTASDMIGTMKPEELQKMFEVASSLNGTSSVAPNLGPNMPEMSPDMVKMASDMIGKMSPDELQNMLNFATQMGRPSGAPQRSENNFQSSRPTTSSSFLRSENNFRPSSSQTIMENPDEISNDQRMGQSSSSVPPSTADMQETMRNSMKDPAMRQMFTSMMKNMSPEMMANMSEQFGMKLSKEDAAKAQQAMSSLSPEDLDRMMRWMERAQQGVEVVKKTKNWLLGKRGLILAIVMLILAFILHQLGFIGG